MMNRVAKIFTGSVFVTTCLIACDDNEQSVENSIALTEQSALDGSWQTTCDTHNPFRPSEYEQELVVIQGASYERIIYSYEDSDCSIPTEIAFIGIRSSDLDITNNTTQTALGEATIFDIGAWRLDVDNSALTDEEVARLYLGYLDPNSDDQPNIDELMKFTRQYFIEQ